MSMRRIDKCNHHSKTLAREAFVTRMLEVEHQPIKQVALQLRVTREIVRQIHARARRRRLAVKLHFATTRSSATLRIYLMATEYGWGNEPFENSRSMYATSKISALFSD